MGELLGGWKRSCYCAELCENDIGKTVTLMGWVQRRRDLGKIIFVWLRDRTGIIQLVFDSDSCQDFHKTDGIKSECVISVVGEVVKRDESAVNPKLKTGMVEVVAQQLKILSAAETPPIYIDDEHVAKEDVRLKYRYLDLRRPSMQHNLMFRHRITKLARDYLDEQGFYEIETPMLTRSTPEGARDYLVPSRVHPGKFYALPQSPQLFKQLLMVAGYDKYFQVARCFRDEDLRADRQPEFTQIDIEMSFVDVDDVLSMNEGLFTRIFKGAMGRELPTPFKRITYREAMDKYGSDKPDTRFGLEIKDISKHVKDSEYSIFTKAIEAGGSVRAIVAKGANGKVSRKDIDALGEHVKTYRAKGLGHVSIDSAVKMRSPLLKYIPEETFESIFTDIQAEVGDIVFMVADADNDIVCTSLGQLRLKLGEKLQLIDDSVFDILWVTQFPLLEYDEGEGRYVAKHHPFTSPIDEDVDLLESNPKDVRAKAYDLVLNGTELGGGSIRIHNSDLQRKMFRVLGFSEEQASERFGFLLEAFNYGPPPHGGIAYGLDRMCMLLLGSESIRDVIAFPKVQNASDLMSDAPNIVDKSQLDELKIKITTD